METLAVFLPLLGAVLAGLFGFVLRDRGAVLVTSSLLTISAVLSWVLFYDVIWGAGPRTVHLLNWVSVDKFIFNWALLIDQLTVVMLVVVTTVSSVVHWYSIGYMHHDKSIPRFFSYLSFFTFFMLMLVTSDNLIQMFFGWEGVGLCSYLLIGFWFDKPSANAAAIKAFVVNRVGDFGYALGIFGVFILFGTIQLEDIFLAASSKSEANIIFLGVEFHAITVLCLLLFVGAMGKSAQLGLHTWLPDAMEGPTPVSALIHAATMVTAGVFMVCRLSPLFEYSETALAVVAVVGASTAFFAATVGLTQNDIKRVIAYSTCSQLGYMFFAAGLSAYGAAMFHLFTHAFFKALLFLGSGCVIHAMSDEQDMRKMGGIRKLVPITYVYMWIGSLALAGIGIPGLGGFAGFHSKDIILESAWAADSIYGYYSFWLGLIAALMTAFYSWRLLFLTFHGHPRCDERTLAHVHESPAIMWVPLLVLAAGALIAGYLGHTAFAGGGDQMRSFWGDALFMLPTHTALENAHKVPLWVKVSPLAAGIMGISIAYIFYIRNDKLPSICAAQFKPLYEISYNKWYFDELYDRIFVRPSFVIGRFLWKSGDGAVIDRLGPDGVAMITLRFSKLISILQTGYVYHYAFAMLIGLVGLVSWYVVSEFLR